MMKTRKIITTAMLLLGVSFVAKAQEQQNLDSICNVNISIARESVKAGNLKDAYEPWKLVMKHRPTLRYYLYTDGSKILKGFLEEIKDRNNPEYKKYFEELMALHDKKIEVTPVFIEKGTRGVPSVEEALGAKAVDYLTLAPKADIDTAYNWLTESVNSSKEESSGQVLYFLLHTSANKIKSNEAHKEQFLQDFLSVSGYIDTMISNAKSEQRKQGFEQLKESTLAIFVGSGTANCETLENIYSSKIEENKDNIEYLKKVISIMGALRCKDSEAYMLASYYSYKIEPTADAAMGCAAQAYKKGDVEGAIKLMTEAIDLETETKAKAEKSQIAATMLAGVKRFTASKSFIYKALELNPNYGEAYILLANIYASNPNWSDEPILNKCTYYVVLDKLQRAKAVDSSVTEEANKLIGKYSAYLPQTKDLFMLGHKKGEKITIGGWIGESTVIR